MCQSEQGHETPTPKSFNAAPLLGEVTDTMWSAAARHLHLLDFGRRFYLAPVYVFGVWMSSGEVTHAVDFFRISTRPFGQSNCPSRPLMVHADLLNKGFVLRCATDQQLLPFFQLND